MDSGGRDRAAMVGRERETGVLRSALARARDGRGSMLAVEGEAGVGKTRLAEEFLHAAEAEGFMTLVGSATMDSGQPFLIFSKALQGIASEDFFSSDSTVKFAAVFALDDSGTLIAESSADARQGAGTLAGMLGAVQSFVQDSFGGTGKGLGRLDYGSTAILFEHGEGVHIAAVLAGGEAVEMRGALADAVAASAGKGREHVASSVDRLASRSFTSRRSLEGVKLENERLRIADGVLRLIAEKARERPVALLAEDLQWADESSLFVLSYLARNVRDISAVIVGTHRTGEGAELAKVLEGMSAEGTVESIKLDRFSEAEVALLVDTVYSPNSIPADFKRRVFADCQGNAFFVMELLRQMSVDGSIAFRDGDFALVRPDYSMPGSAEEVVARRLEGLDIDAMALAEYASCVGREFPVGAVKSLQSVADPDGSIVSLEAAHVIVRSGDSAEFTHAFFHDYIYRNVADRWKSAHHRSLGAYYEREFAGNLGGAAYELAKHFYRGGESAKAAQYCFLAGEKAEGAFAAQEAIKYYKQSLESDRRAGRPVWGRELELLRRLGSLTTMVSDFAGASEIYREALGMSSEPGVKADIHRNLSNVLMLMSDFDGANETITQGLALTGPETVVHWLMQSQRARLLIYKGELKEAARLVEEAIERLGSLGASDRDVTSALNALGGIYFKMGDFKGARVTYQKMLALGERSNDLNGMANGYNNIGATFNWTGDIENAMASYEKGLALWEKLGNLYGMSSTLSNMGVAITETGEFERVLEYHERSLAIRRKIGHLEGIATSLSNIGATHYRRGELSKALPFMKESLEIRTQLDDRMGIGNSLNNLSEVHDWMGDLELALEYMVKALRIEEDAGDMEGVAFSRTHLGLLRLEKGDVAGAMEMLRRGLATSREIGLDEYALIAMRGLVEARLAEGDLTGAESWLKEAEKLSEGSEVELDKIVVERAKGLVLSAKGEHEAAAETMGSALSRFAKVNAMLWRAQATVDLGKILLRGGKREAGIARLTEARELGERLGLGMIVMKCRKALE